MFVPEYLHFSEAALKCDIVGKEDNYYKQFTTWSSSFHSYSATSCEYGNVEVKEKSVN